MASVSRCPQLRRIWFFHPDNSRDTPNDRLVPIGYHRRAHPHYFANRGMVAAYTM